MDVFESNNLELLELIRQWTPKLSSLTPNTITSRRNGQGRTIKQITGHMVDSASNNIHRIVHLQYGKNPLDFPDYANLGNNERWIAIQDYQSESWQDLVGLWKYINLHIVHVIRNVDREKLDNVWVSALGDKMSLRDMITDYLRHFRLHLHQIEELILQSE